MQQETKITKLKISVPGGAKKCESPYLSPTAPLLHLSGAVTLVFLSREQLCLALCRMLADAQNFAITGMKKIG